MTPAVRTVHIDIEGGWGGSSRSLYQLVAGFDRTRVDPVIVHRQTGPLEDWYKRIGVPTVLVPEIASFVPRRKNSAKIFIANLPTIIRKRQGVGRIVEIIRNRDSRVIHLNYEGLFLLAPRLKVETGLPIVCHYRTHLPENVWARWLVHQLSQSVDHFFFISPQEEIRVRMLQRRHSVPGNVLWNIAPKPLARQTSATPPEAVYLGNLDASKGVDRLIDIAFALDERDAPPLMLAIYGQSRRGNTAFVDGMKRRIIKERLQHRIELRGFTPDPEKVLTGALALIRPSRENDPWGRDVIEATAFGVPVLATGNFAGVVEPGVTGFLFDPFDPKLFADQLVKLIEYPELWHRLSAEAVAKGQRVFGGGQQLKLVTEIFERLAKDIS